MTNLSMAEFILKNLTVAVFSELSEYNKKELKMYKKNDYNWQCTLLNVWMLIEIFLTK